MLVTTQMQMPLKQPEVISRAVVHPDPRMTHVHTFDLDQYDGLHSGETEKLADFIV